MTIREYQERVDYWITKYGVRYFNELTNLAILNEEVGELSRLFAREYGEQSFKQPMEKEEVRQRIEDETADIFFVLACIANQTGIDLEAAVEKNIQKKTAGDRNRHQSNQKLRS